MVKIIADTLSSLPVSLAAELDIPYLPQIIIIDDKSYRDDTEMDSATFLQNLKTARSLPKTAAPPPALYAPIYDKYAARGDTMIVICPSAEVSGTFRGATIGAQDFPDADIRVIDTRTIGSGMGQIVLEADRMAKEGCDADTIVNRIQEMASSERLFFLVDTLEYLYKGGRIGGAQALVGSILQVKPILTLKNGRIEPAESQRTKARAMARICELVESECPHGPQAHLSIMQCNAEDDARKLADHFSQKLGIKDIPIYLLPPAILVHAGPGALAVTFFTK